MLRSFGRDFKFTSMKQLTQLRRLKKALFHDPSAFCRVKCAQAGMERDRSGEVENTVPSCQHMKISGSQTGVFGRMERAHMSLPFSFQGRAKVSLKNNCEKNRDF